MTDTRAQIAARAVAELSWKLNSVGFRIAAAHAAAGVSEGVRAVTDRVRGLHRPCSHVQGPCEVRNGKDITYCHECEAVDYPCPTVRLLDQIDAEWG